MRERIVLCRRLMSSFELWEENLHFCNLEMKDLKVRREHFLRRLRHYHSICFSKKNSDPIREKFSQRTKITRRFWSIVEARSLDDLFSFNDEFNRCAQKMSAVRSNSIVQFERDFFSNLIRNSSLICKLTQERFLYDEINLFLSIRVENIEIKESIR